MRDHLSGKTRYSWPKVLHFNVSDPVIKDHLPGETTFVRLMRRGGGVFQDRLYYIWNYGPEFVGPRGVLYIQVRLYYFFSLVLKSKFKHTNYFKTSPQTAAPAVKKRKYDWSHCIFFLFNCIFVFLFFLYLPLQISVPPPLCPTHSGPSSSRLHHQVSLPDLLAAGLIHWACLEIHNMYKGTVMR